MSRLAVTSRATTASKAGVKRNSITALAAALPLSLLFGCGGPADGPDAAAERTDTPEVETSQSNLLYDVMGSTKQNGFDAGRRTHGWFCIGNEHCDVGDFNGDGRDDLVTILDSGTTYVALSNSSGLGYTSNTVWSSNLGRADVVYTVGDVDGDGRDDIMRVVPRYGYVYVARSTGAGFESPRFVRMGMCLTGETCKLGDVNGDGRADLVRFFRATGSSANRGSVQVALSNGPGFDAPTTWATGFCIFSSEICDVGDFDRNGTADIVVFPSAATYGSDGGAYLAVSNRTNAFVRNDHVLENYMCPRGYYCATGDTDGDGRDDLIAFANGTGFADSGLDYRNDVHVAQVFGTWEAPYFAATPSRIRADAFCPAGHVCRVGDMNGDGKADLVAFARDSLPGSGRGDVFVALSNYGDPRTFVLDFDSISASSTEGSGDKPLLLGLSFRSTFGRRNSTSITRNTYNETFAQGIQAGGPSIAIPASVGEFTFGNVRLKTPGEVFSAQQMEVFGAAVVMIEKDLSAAAAYPGLMDEAERALTTILQNAVEQTSMLELAAPGALEAALWAAANQVQGDIQVSIIDNVLHLVLSAPWDPDDIVDFHVVIFPAVDKALSDWVPTSTSDLVSIKTPGEGWLGHYPQNIEFANGPMRYLVNTRLR